MDVKEEACAVAESQNWPDEVLKELASIADHFFFDKQGAAKDPHTIIRTMLQADALRKEVKESLQADNATELSGAEVTRCFKKWSTHFLKTRLTGTQKRDKKYKLVFNDDDTLKLTSFQRSFVNAMLRKEMASKFVAFATWQICVPQFLNKGSMLHAPQ